VKPANRNFVRIIGGAWRGRRVHFADSPGLRPTPDRVRETLFNWLQQAIAGARCLDLFAGSGALGLESLSRGAREVVFVEESPTAARSVAAQAARLGAGDAPGDAAGAARHGRARVLQMSAERFLSAPGEPFDVIFLDPPFAADALAEPVRLIDSGGWAVRGALVYLECARAAGVPPLPPTWELLKSKLAGEVGYHLARVQARA